MDYSHAAQVVDRYKDYGELGITAMRRLKKISAMVPITGNLLEIGALDGATVRYYKQHFKGKTFGVDISIEVLKNAGNIIDEVKTCDLNVDALPWEDNFFDVVICSEIIEHIFDTDRLLEQIRRILKPSGTLIISTPNLASFFNRIFILFGLQPVGTEVSCRNTRYGNSFRQKLRPAGHIRNFTYAAFIDILRTNGFKIERTTSIPMSEHGVAAVIETVTSGIYTAFGSVIIVKCKRDASYCGDSE